MKKYLWVAAMVSLALAFGIPVEAAGMPQQLSKMELLGKALYFDTSLSTPNGQSCASCHNPQVGWTGPSSYANEGGAVIEGAVPGRFGNRKPPSAAYATPSPKLSHTNGHFRGGNFWDGRATGEGLGSPAADQALGPFLNPLEMNNASEKEVCESVKVSTFAKHLSGYSYQELFDEVFGPGSLRCDMGYVDTTYDRFGLAIAAYEDCHEVNQYSSKYDRWTEGKAQLSWKESKGHDLFMGRCVGCHPPPDFTDFGYHNLGVPKNPENPFYYQDPMYNPDGKYWVDPGLGGFLAGRDDYKDFADMNYGKHKTPSLRNVDKRAAPGFVKAFTHNGVMKSVKEMVHFLNTRDDGSWPPPEEPRNVSPIPGKFGLKDWEEDAIVAFVGTLSDGWGMEDSGEQLYMDFCMGCHGSADPANMDMPPSAPRKVIGARSCSIKGAIYGTYVFRNGVPAMQFLQDALTDEKIVRIADYLNWFDGITGEQRFVTTCAGCHGWDGSGGPVDEDVQGEDGEEIKEAIYDEWEMRFLKCLPWRDVKEIGYHLSWMYDDDDCEDDDSDDDCEDDEWDDDHWKDGWHHWDEDSKSSDDD